MRLPRVIAKLRRSSSQLGWRSRRRDLRRELKEQSTEKYWRRRDRARSRRFRPLDVLGGVILSLLREFALGGLLLAPVVVLDMGLSLAPSEDSASRLGAFPTLAVQVTASLLGFYLASVGIVLGTSYRDVSNDVRDLVLRSSRTRFYLRAIGMTIGGGSALYCSITWESRSDTLPSAFTLCSSPSAVGPSSDSLSERSVFSTQSRSETRRS